MENMTTVPPAEEGTFAEEVVVVTEGNAALVDGGDVVGGMVHLSLHEGDRKFSGVSDAERAGYDYFFSTIGTNQLIDTSVLSDFHL